MDSSGSGEIYSREQRLVDIDHKLKSLYTLGNRLDRYWKKIAATSIVLAKNAGIETHIIDADDMPIHSSTRINVYRHDDKVDDRELLLLSKNLLPSLHRRYAFGLEDYAACSKALKTMVDCFRALYGGTLPKGLS